MRNFIAMEENYLEANRLVQVHQAGGLKETCIRPKMVVADTTYKATAEFE